MKATNWVLETPAGVQFFWDVDRWFYQFGVDGENAIPTVSCFHAAGEPSDVMEQINDKKAALEAEYPQARQRWTTVVAKHDKILKDCLENGGKKYGFKAFAFDPAKHNEARIVGQPFWRTV